LRHWSRWVLCLSSTSFFWHWYPGNSSFMKPYLSAFCSSRLGLFLDYHTDISPDLASHSRLLLYDRPKYTRLYRWLALYPLYALAEIAIIATDLAELLGSAIALCLLFPKLQLWHGVLLTSVDVILILGMGDPLGGRPSRVFEGLITIMVCLD